ncbi:MAG: 16S rRNA (cytosine(967)-C(5))-methyltransferase RsmB [Burkholderiaceae bacterium]|nr:16S rRNA (cytosine(967)-C(5))-methyltransferase RsmB [Burkholderiaceae bacterium]
MPAASPAPALSQLLAAVAEAVAAVRGGRSLTEALARTPPALRPGTQALAFQVLRQLGAALVLRQLLAPKTPPPEVEALLLSALALSWPAADGSPPPYAEHTLVDQAVAAVRKRSPRSAGFVNAVLRRWGRERQALQAQALQQPMAAHQHPAWWVQRVRADWPQQAEALLAAANRHPPMALRVNARRGTAAAYVARLAEAGLPATTVDHPALDQAVVLARPAPVEALPGFAAGEVSVQDLSAQRAAPLVLEALDGLPPLRAGAHVLDACAAPGGKTAHLLERRPDLDLLALDADAQRLARVRQTLERLGLMAGNTTGNKAELKAADAGQVSAWWDGRPFDAILLDAPCTASGIVRRHPDVRWLRRPEDIAALAAQQRRLLDALWPLLAPGGRLVYATCSLFAAEGRQQIDAFLQRQADSSPRLAQASPGHLLPLPDNPAQAGAGFDVSGDGFFYAVLIKP